MKRLKFLGIGLALTGLISCGGGVGDQPATAEGFGEIEKELTSKFGADAYYTDLSILYIDKMGNTISTTVTSDPESLEMGEWSYSNSAWTQSADVTIEIPDGTKATDFMFQLGGEISLSELGGLIEKSKKMLADEKDVPNAKLSIASILFPDNGDMAEAKYSVTLEPETGGTSFSFYYDLKGEFISMDY